MECRNPPRAVLKSPSLEVFKDPLGVALGDRVLGCWGNGWTWEVFFNLREVFSNLNDSTIWVPMDPYIYFNILSVPHLEFLPRFYRTLKNDGSDWFGSRFYPQMCTSKSLWEAQSWTSHCFHLYSFLFYYFCCCCFNWS